MKKYLILVGILSAACITMAGCGSIRENREENVIAQKEPEQAKEVDSEEPIDIAEASEQQTYPEQAAFLALDITNTTLNSSDAEHNRYEIVKVTYTQVELSEEESERHPALAKALSEKNATQESSMSERLADLTEQYYDWESYGVNYDGLTYENSFQGSVLRADQSVLCVLYNNYFYEGGAHGYTSLSGEAYEVETGKKLALLDVVTDEEMLTDCIRKQLLTKYPDIVDDDSLNDFFENISYSGEGEIGWSMDYNGITVYIGPYMLGSFADGNLTARISFSQNEKLFDERYINTPKDYIMPLPNEICMYADLDGDGQEEEVNLFGVENAEGWDGYDWGLQVGDTSLEELAHSYRNESFLVHKGGKFYAYMINTVENDYQILNIIDMASGKELGGEYGMSNVGLHVSDFDYEEGYFWEKTSAFVNPYSVMLDSRLDVFSTYSGSREYYISDEGIPQSKDAFYTVDRMGYLITPVRDIPCKLVDKDGNILEEHATLPAGTMLRIIRTDGETCADMQAGDYELVDVEYQSEEYPYYVTEDPLDLNRGTFYRVEYENVNYERMIDGESIFDLFKGMVYAG